MKQYCSTCLQRECCGTELLNGGVTANSSKGKLPDHCGYKPCNWTADASKRQVIRYASWRERHTSLAEECKTGQMTWKDVSTKRLRFWKTAQAVSLMLQSWLTQGKVSSSNLWHDAVLHNAHYLIGGYAPLTVARAHGFYGRPALCARWTD